MAIVKTTASGEFPEKKDTSKTTPVKPAREQARVGGPLVRQGAKPATLKEFLQDTNAELKRVVWPPRDQVRAGVIVTVGLLVFFSLYIYGLDQLFGLIFTKLGLYPESVVK